MSIRHSPSDAPSNVNISSIWPLDKRFSPGRHLRSSRLQKVGGSGREAGMIWLDVGVFARQADLSCRFRSV